MGRAPIEFTREIIIHGLSINSGLTIVNHLKDDASMGGRKLMFMRRISNMFDVAV